MLVTVDIESKSLGNKQLFSGLHFTIETNEKVAIIGRNGVGKTTLFNLLTDQDGDFAGSIQFRKGAQVMSTAQEHAAVGDQTVLEYVVGNLPDFARLKTIIDTYPDTMGEDMRKIGIYSDALERFAELDYYNVDDNVLRSLDKYQIDSERAHRPIRLLSGGQKRFVELVRIEHADADIALIDEPTNHMDYVAKSDFVGWLKSVNHTVVVISHDRDVLQAVDKIIEIKDGRSHIVRGNYSAYLKQNATSTTAKMHEYEVAQRSLLNLEKQIQSVRAKKASTSKTPNPFISLERRLLKEAEDLRAKLVKPNFWIDQESVAEMKQGAVSNYAKYKAKNIRIKSGGKDAEGANARELLRIEDLQLGYGEQPLFQPANASLQHGQRLQLVGRNGVGKSTLVRAISEAAPLDGNAKRAETWKAGSILCDNKLRLSIYEQETDAGLFDLTLHEAIEKIYSDFDLPVGNEIIMRLMGDYLFDPHVDARLPVGQLSGGQKARLQIIKLMAPNPNLLILDEPTNHLDLPSIEEIENALKAYHGAILYVSHDSFFAKNIGGETLTLQAV